MKGTLQKSFGTRWRKGRVLTTDPEDKKAVWIDEDTFKAIQKAGYFVQERGDRCRVARALFTDGSQRLRITGYPLTQRA